MPFNVTPVPTDVPAVVETPQVTALDQLAAIYANAGSRTAPSLNLGTMRSLVFALADEEPSAIFTPAVVDKYINAGIQKVSRTVPEQISTHVTDKTPAEWEIELPDPLVEGKDCAVERVFVNGSKLTQIEYDSITNFGATGQARNFYVRGGRVGIYPNPTETVNVIVDYVRNPAELTADSHAPELSYTAAIAACKYAVYLMKLSDDEYGSADRWKADFERDLLDISGPSTGIYRAE